MGANGSTAASCSSLELNTNQQQIRREHYRKRQQLHEQRIQLQRYNIAEQQQVPTNHNLNGFKNKSKANMKQSNSYFDLTAPSDQHLAMQSAAWLLDTSNQTADSQAYNHSRPVMVLPPSTCNPKKSNAGVASRVLQQQQFAKRSNELKKFSDSLPSLNFDMLNQQVGQISNPSDGGENLLYPCRQQQISAANSSNNYCKNNSANSKPLINMKSHNRAAINQPNIHLVNRGAKDATDFSFSQYKLVDNRLQPTNRAANNLQQPNQAANAISSHRSSSQIIKRAISLSSLHNSHNHHQNDHQNLKLNNEQLNGNRMVYKQHQQKIVSNLNSKHLISSTRPESMNDHITCDMQQPFSNNNYNNKRVVNQNLQPHSQQQQQYNLPTPLAKKILKFKQVSGGGGQKRYKSKLQPQQPQQQGCPVLPPLPRSQSLHELIQLRATENGQRMRTTGTLRGPLGANDGGNKVNLVVELLENRRQQKLSEESTGAGISGANIKDSATMVSQSSSTDDGIHDVSITGCDQSTGDSRGRYDNERRRFSSASQEFDVEQSAAGKQRIFKKNSQLVGCASSSQYQKRFNSQQQTNFHDRPQSQQLGTSLSPKAMVAESCLNQVQQAKSTLKRSVSHSALQTSLNNLQQVENDEDESDDLNELAKFLHQFKQRQVAANKARPEVETNRDKIQHSMVASSDQKATNNLQQSPNSTTSSSGFASSTFNSNSISSSASDKSGHKPDLKSQPSSSQKTRDCQQKPVGRKKYPAPPRPDEPSSKSQANEQQQQQANGKAKCLISGKLKLSSSLLSIVDEYNSTLQSNQDQVSPVGSHHLTSVLLNGEAKTVAAQVHDDDDEIDVDRINKVDSSSEHRRKQLNQLEQLKRYTQLRQMSQSELALNHLTSELSSSSNQRHGSGQKGSQEANRGKSSGKRESISSKPYTSKLINLIRRISDKSEQTSRNGGAGSAQPVSSASGNAVGGRNKRVREADCANQLRAINQTESIVPYSNQCSSSSNNNSSNIKLQKGHNQGQDYSKAASVAVDGSLSESLCDLNFDCDFELIKNCGSTSTAAAANEYKPAMAGKQKQAANSLLPLYALDPRANGRSSNNNKRQKEAAKKHCQQQQLHQRQQQAINSSKGENNWRLVPASLSLTRPAGFGDGKEGQQNRKQQQRQEQQVCKPSADDAEKKGRKAVCKLHAPVTNKLAAQPKLKWPSSGLLMNGGDDAKNKVQGSAKSCLTKLISSSRAPLSGSSIDSSSAEAAKVNREASQLLDELDHSLDLVSTDCAPFSRRAALSLWKMGDGGLVGGEGKERLAKVSASRAANDGLLLSTFSLSSDDEDGNDDDDDDNYASINRAMINATFGVSLTNVNSPTIGSELSIEPGSPSDSFTFSAPSSPTEQNNTNVGSNQKATIQLISKAEVELHNQHESEAFLSQAVRKLKSGCNQTAYSTEALPTTTTNTTQLTSPTTTALVSSDGGGLSKLTVKDHDLDSSSGSRQIVSDYGGGEQRVEDDGKMMTRAEQIGLAPTCDLHNGKQHELGRFRELQQQHNSGGCKLHDDVGVKKQLSCDGNAIATINSNLKVDCCGSKVLTSSAGEQRKLVKITSDNIHHSNSYPLEAATNGQPLSESRSSCSELNCPSNSDGVHLATCRYCCAEQRKTPLDCRANHHQSSSDRCDGSCHHEQALKQPQQQQPLGPGVKCNRLSDAELVSPNSKPFQGQIGAARSTCCVICNNKGNGDFDKTMSGQKQAQCCGCHSSVSSNNNERKTETKPSGMRTCNLSSNNNNNNKCCPDTTAQGEFVSRDLHADNGLEAVSQCCRMVAAQSDKGNNRLIIREGSCHCLSDGGCVNELTTATAAVAKAALTPTKNRPVEDIIKKTSPLAPSAALNSSSGSMVVPTDSDPNSPANSELTTKTSSYYYEMGKFSRFCGAHEADRIYEGDDQLKRQRHQANSVACGNCVNGFTKCKVATCYHPSPYLSQTNCNEDIKLQEQRHHESCCVRRDKLIASKAGHKLEPEGEISGSKMHKKQVADSVVRDSPPSNGASINCLRVPTHDDNNCRCCNLTKQHLIRANRGDVARSESNNGSKLSPANQIDGRPLCGAARLLEIKPKLTGSNNVAAICRSNSELLSGAPSCNGSKRGGSNGGSSNGSNKSSSNRQQQPLFGRLRSSLLDHHGYNVACSKKPALQAAASAAAFSKSSKLASSQLSLVNYYSGAHFVSPFITSSPDYGGQVMASNSVEFDENFILKRKTPNAGLKSHC